MSEMVKTIRLSASLREVAGAKEVRVSIPPGGTVRDLLDSLRQVNAPLAARILTPGGDLHAGIQLIVGGRHIEFLQGLDTPIDNQDNLLLVPPLSGG